MVRIISGGQTGVDRAALDAALDAGLPCGGWCPAGRRAEDGAIPERYPLRETESENYRARTRLNVHAADVTLILTRDAPTGGTLFTLELARELGRPHLVIDLAGGGDAEAVAKAIRGWLEGLTYRTLNVAGPRESGCPGIYGQARAVLDELFSAIPRSA